MTIIKLSTSIQAPINTVFDLSRDIDFHKKTLSQTQEEAISGVTSGLIGQGETVTWRGKHFGVWLTHTSIISEFDKPRYFVDEMIKGNFKSFRHEHHFTTEDNKTIVKDRISYKTPYGLLGKLFDVVILKRHLTKLISSRNLHIKKKLED